MSESAVSEQVQRFLYDYIGSVAQLEILLLLQTNSQQSWSAQAIARELRIESAGASQQLALLATAGLVRTTPPSPDAPATFAYAPQTPDLQAAVTALAQAYLIRRVTVIGLIHAKPPGGGGGASLRAFSDAFRLRKDPPHGPPG